MDNRAGASIGRALNDHPFAPVIVNRPPLKERSALKVVAFNAAGGRYFPQIIECLRRPPLQGADVILLCEAGWRLKRSDGREFAAELAEGLGMSFAFMAEFGIPRSSGPMRAFMGNAILSSRPLTEVYGVPLPNPFLRSWVRRGVGAPAGLIAKVSFNGRSITVGVAHLNSRCDPSGRERQMRDYLAQFPRDGAALIGGDFNTTTVDLRTRAAVLKAICQLASQPRRLREPARWEPLFERLAESGFEVRGANAHGKSTFTFSGMIPPLIRPKLDWVALRGIDPLPGSATVIRARSSLFGRRISDHDFIVCDLEL
jgi:endonuclease/exonuclease/phosphatase family metal-dependent hydrolase